MIYLKIQTNSKTIVDKGLQAGDLVQVSGWVSEDNTWLAKSILHKVDETSKFIFSGEIEQIDPWIISGVEFNTQTWTHIDEGLAVGDRVRVSGQILEDGTWLAYEIVRIEEPGQIKFILIGPVTSKQPWVVSGHTLNIDEETTISGEITLGMLVRVEVQIQANGTWKAISIQPVEGFTWNLGCQEIVARLVSISGDKISLQDWPELSFNQDLLNGEKPTPNSILSLQICFGEDDNLQIVSIVILYQPPIEEIESAEQNESPNAKVMICHKSNGKNPHTIVVSQSAVPAHLDHGDYLGTCP